MLDGAVKLDVNTEWEGLYVLAEGEDLGAEVEVGIYSAFITSTLLRIKWGDEERDDWPMCGTIVVPIIVVRW